MTGAAPSIGTRTGICPKGLQHINRSASSAVVHSIPTMDVTVPVSASVWPGRRKLVQSVNKDIIGYCSAIAQARRMLKSGIINLDDYEKIDHVLLEKYKLPLSSIYRDITLIDKKTRGNMST